MTILLVNDDGYRSEGISILDQVLSAAGHEIWTMAPSGNRSAQSHAMNISADAVITRYGDMHYHCSGTPTDCVLYALRTDVFPHRPDLVISGINHGYNCSTDVLYSGTCSAASEAVVQGVPAIALSADVDKNGLYDFASAAAWAADNLDRLATLAAAEGSFVNVNFPNPFSGHVRASELGYVIYPDKPVEKSAEGDVRVFGLTSAEGRHIRHTGEDSDFHVTAAGDIAVSVIRILPEIDRAGQALIAKVFS